MVSEDFSVRILDPDGMKIWDDGHGNLRLSIDEGEDRPLQKVVRAFPITMPWNYIVFVGGDGRQIGVLKNVDSLDDASKKVLREYLEKAYFIPKIVRIHSIKEEFGVLIWEVDTDKGPRMFEVTNRRDVRKITGRRILVKDTDGNLYDITDVRELDQKSMVLLEPVI